MDGTKNKQGTITSFADLTVKIDERWMNLRLLITGLGKQKIILGFPWLNEHNPDINWRTGEFSWRQRRPLRIMRRSFEGLHLEKPLAQTKELARRAIPAPVITEETDKDTHLNKTQNPVINKTDILTTLVEEEEIWINTKTSNAIEFHLQHDKKKEDLPLKEQIPKTYHEYLKNFDEKEANRFPESRPWDHKIKLKEGFQPKSFKSYNLTPKEQTELDKFLKKNLEKGYIRPSQSPMATPFFFVKKKDGKLRPCQDYRYLMPTHYPSFRNSWIRSKTPNILQNWMFNGGTIISEFASAINGKQPSKQTEDHSNQQLCFSECVTPQPLFSQ